MQIYLCGIYSGILFSLLKGGYLDTYNNMYELGGHFVK